MRRSIKMASAILAGIVSLAPLSAGLWDSCCLNGSWAIGVEALYWKPCICEWEYGFSNFEGAQDGVPTNVARSVNPDYDWGVRVLGSYLPCSGCTFLTLDWTYLRNTDQASEPRVNILGTTLSHVAARMRFRYNRINLRGGYYLHRGCNIDFYVYAGGRWVDFEQRRDLFVGDTLRAKETAEMGAGGIEFGVGGLYAFDCGVSLVGNVGGVALIGERRRHFESNGFSAVQDRILYPSRTICFPGLDFRIGLNTEFTCSCFTVTPEIGYEMNYYFHPLATFASWGQSDNNRASVCQNIGFAGFYASLTARF